MKPTNNPGLFPIITILALAVVGSILIGRYPVPGFIRIGQIMDDPVAQRLILHLRMPRVVSAILLGAALAAGGTVFQMIFSNPLVEPGFLGVSQGAAFGAALAIVALGAHPVTVQSAAFVFAVVGLFLSYTIARIFYYGGWILRLVLAGIAVSAIFSAGIGILKLTADPMSQLPDITFWLLGGLWSVGWDEVLRLLLPVIGGLAVLTAFRWKLNVLSLDERVAHSLGSSPRLFRLLLLGAATLATSAVISVSGLVGWAGLMIPHAARRIYGTDARKALPASMLLGSIFILLCDSAARSVLDAEIPLGILTSLLGACTFLVLMAARNKERGG